MGIPDLDPLELFFEADNGIIGRKSRFALQEKLQKLKSLKEEEKKGEDE